MSLDRARPGEKIVNKFGGPKALAELLGRSESTVANWPSAGIPWREHGRLLDAATRLGLRLTRRELEASQTKRKNGAPEGR